MSIGESFRKNWIGCITAVVVWLVFLQMARRSLPLSPETEN